jgi:hypothetical protein
LTLALTGGPDSRGDVPFFLPGFFRPLLETKKFIELARAALITAKQNSFLIISYLSMLASPGVPELHHHSELAHIQANLMSTYSDEEAGDLFVNMLQKCLG